MSDASLFRRGLVMAKELLLWPWWTATSAECSEPFCSSGPAARLDDLRQSPKVSQITWLGGATVLIQMGRHRALVDPVIAPRSWRFGRSHKLNSLSPWKNVGPIDVIVVTHRAVLDPRLLQAASRRTPVVVPTGLGAEVCRRGFDQVVELAAGEQFADGDLDVIALRTMSVPRLQRIWTRGGNVATWGGLSVRISRTNPEDAISQAVWLLRHPGGHPREFGRLVDLGPCPDVILVPLDDQKAVWPTRSQQMLPETAIEAFRSIGGRVFIPLGPDSAQDTSVPDACTARLRSLWEAHPPPGATLVIPQIGETVDVPGF